MTLQYDCMCHVSSPQAPSPSNSMSPIEVSRSLKTISQPCEFVQQIPSRPFGMSGIVPGRFILPLVASFYIIIRTWHSLAC